MLFRMPVVMREFPARFQKQRFAAFGKQFQIAVNRTPADIGLDLPRALVNGIRRRVIV